MSNSSFPDRIERRIRNMLWARTPLGWDLRSGLKLEVANEAEWVLYGGIFVDGEYDFAIRRALERAGQTPPLHVLDLGANVGFFALRLVDTILREYGRDYDFSATLVEGSPSSAAELRRRLGADPLIAGRVNIVHGLAGKRSGTATIFEHAFHAANSINNPVMEREGKGTEVSFVDVAKLTQHMPRIHLLKCDIEGAELIFLESYADLLEKVETIVLELHPGLCDVPRCRQILHDAGFAKHTLIREMADQSVEHFERV